MLLSTSIMAHACVCHHSLYYKLTSHQKSCCIKIIKNVSYSNKLRERLCIITIIFPLSVAPQTVCPGLTSVILAGCVGRSMKWRSTNIFLLCLALSLPTLQLSLVLAGSTSLIGNVASFLT